MAKKILIHTRNLKIPGGKQSYFIALKDHFKIDAHYFYYGAKNDVPESGLTFIKRFFSDYINFYKLLKKGDYDLVHINTSLNPKSYFRDSVFTLISTFLKYKTVVYWHGWQWDFERKYAGRIRPYFRFTYGKADAMICLANKFAEQIKSYGYKKPIFLETTVVEDLIFKIPVSNLSNPRVPAVKRLLFLSRIEKVKGIYESIDSFNGLRKTWPDLQFLIAGTGSELDKVKEYVQLKEIGGVQFLGWIDGIKKTEILQKADIFLLPSYAEGMPIAVLEAMASGLPVVTTYIGGIKDFFVDGKMGLKVNIMDAGDLERKLEKLLRDSDLRSRMGKFNRDYAETHFRADLVCKRLEEIYEAVLEEKL